MNILKVSCAFIFLLSCNNKKQHQVENVKANHLFLDSINFYFIDSITNDTLKDYKFGIYTNKVELPIEDILTKSDCVKIIHNKTFVFLNNIKNFNKNKDSLYGYFSKIGFCSRKFLIRDNVNNSLIKVKPAPSMITLKAINKEVSSRLDSISVTFDKKKVKEFFHFKNNDVDRNLEYFTHEINFNETMTVDILVYTKNGAYSIKRVINYIPCSNTIVYIF